MIKLSRLYFACDLKDHPVLIQQYVNMHAPGKVWPEITKSIRDAGIANMEIYMTGNRLFMVMDVDENFDPEIKNKMDKENPKVQEWESLMWHFQQSLPWAKDGAKWIPLKRIFSLD